MTRRGRHRSRAQQWWRDEKFQEPDYWFDVFFMTLLAALAALGVLALVVVFTSS